MKKLLHLLSSLLKDNNDDVWSSTRFALLLTVVLSNFSIFGVWVVVCIINRDIINIPSSIITLYSLANGITLSGKVVQKRHELKHGNRKQ